jgi:cytochrome c biogenesis protein
MNRCVRLFSDVRFAVSLFAFWGLLTLIGVIIDQGKETAYYFSTYPPPFARLLLRLHWDTIYHGPAYLGIIGAILASLAVCTFKRVIPARLPPLRAVATERIPLNARIEWHGSESDLRLRLHRFLQTHGWSIRLRSIDAVEWTFADKANWARRGVLVAHTGFVLIAAGTSLFWARGYSGEMTAKVGESIVLPQTHAKLHLDDFQARIDPIQTKGGIVYQPVDYVSRLHISDQERRNQEVTLRVNHPLDLDGVAVYQAAYGVATQFAVTRNGRSLSGLPTGAIEEGEEITLLGTTRSLRYARFIGTLGAGGMPTPDPRPNRPGVILTVLDGGNPSGTIILPFGQKVDLGGGFSLTPLRTVYYTGFQYRYDPGIPLVGIGAFVLLAGLCISFFFLPARLYARIDGEGERWRISLAASTVKGYIIFEEQFNALIRALHSNAAMKDEGLNA